MEMRSIWEETARPGSFPPLDRDIQTDVLIIGGGMCGLLCAYLLQQAGVDYVPAEADTVCGGTTKNTTAKITYQHGLIYHKLVKQFGAEKAKQYYLANQKALERYFRLCREMVDCDFESKPSYVYALDSSKELEQEMAALKTLGIAGTLCTATSLPFPVAGAVKMEGQGQFHPLKFVSALSEGLNIYEHTRILALNGTRAVTRGAAIQAKRVLVTTHFPFLNRHGAYFLKLYQHRSYVIALKNAPQIDGMYVDAAQKGMSLRSWGDLLLLGGGGHRTGKQGGNWQELRDFASRYYPNATECAHWAAQDCMSLDGVPYIGRYSPNMEGIYVASGFQKWGMTTSMVAAMLLSDAVQGKENPYSSFFAPDRSMLHPQLAVNAWEATTSLLTPTAKRCPHLGCALKWNPWEHSWDCPCHGSRFTEDGKLIDNPATGDLKRR